MNFSKLKKITAVLSAVTLTAVSAVCSFSAVDANAVDE